MVTEYNTSASSLPHIYIASVTYVKLFSQDVHNMFCNFLTWVL